MTSKKIFFSLKTAFVSVTVQTLMECCVVFGISARYSLFAFHGGLYCLLVFRSTL